jgi:RND family efflux transporter MFP subunit
MTKSQRILNIVLLPALIVLAVFIVKAMIAGKPERIMKKPKQPVPAVSYILSEPATIRPTITTYGNVSSYYEAQLSAQVRGEIQQIASSFNSGQNVAKGELLVEIDPADYLTAIAQQEANLATAEQAYSQEATRAGLAEQDWLESGRVLEDASSLTLRKPQLATAEAGIASARANVEKARLDLARTKIRAPFDAIVQNRSASPGNVVSVGSLLGTLIAKERAEVRLPLTPQQVRRLDLPMNGANPNLQARLTTPTQPNAEWLATISRTEPGVNRQNQVIYVVGEIEDPFEDPQAFLPIGAFVDATIPAEPIEDAHRIPSTALVEDAYAWVIAIDNTLQKVSVTRLITDGDDLIVRFEPEINDDALRVATRPLASFRSGQSVKPNAPRK